MTGLVAAHVIPLPQRLDATDSTLVRFADGSPAYVFLSSDERWRLSVTPAEVDPRYLDALLRFEDKRYYDHPGVDPLAVRKALLPSYPQLAPVHLTDYKVRILDGDAGTAAQTRVLIDSSDGEQAWSTVGSSTNIIEASWQALAYSLEYALWAPAGRRADSDQKGPP